jgi:hypothetical protein
VSGLVITGVAAIVNVCGFDVPPPGPEFVTVIEAVPGLATREAGTTAVSCVEETNVVASDVAFHLTVDVETKFVPFTVNVKPTLPAVTQLGLIDVVVGAGLLMVKVTGCVIVAQLLNVTLKVTLYVPVVVGVPEIKPVDVLTVKPGGNPLAP